MFLLDSNNIIYYTGNEHSKNINDLLTLIFAGKMRTIHFDQNVHQNLYIKIK